MKTTAVESKRFDSEAPEKRDLFWCRLFRFEWPTPDTLAYKTTREQYEMSRNGRSNNKVSTQRKSIPAMPRTKEASK